MGLADDLAANVTKHAVDLDRFGEDLSNQVEVFLQDLGDDVERQLKNVNPMGSQRVTVRERRLRKLKEQIEETIPHRIGQTQKHMESELTKLADIEQDFVVNNVNNLVDVELMTTALSQEDLEELVTESPIQGSTQAEWWDRQAADVKERYLREIRLGMGAGEDMEQIARRLSGSERAARTKVMVGDSERTLRGLRGGAMDVTRREARALARTGVQTVSNNVQNRIYEDNRDVLRGRQAQVTLDTRTTKLCMSRSGAAWDFDGKPLPDSAVQIDYPGNPPWHFQCRTVIVPVVKPWSELLEQDVPEPPTSTQASMDGQVAGDLNYESWLAQQSAERQIDVLGPGRHKLWQEGKLTFQQLVNNRGRPLTLNQLRARTDRTTQAKLEEQMPPGRQPLDDMEETRDWFRENVPEKLDLEEREWEGRDAYVETEESWYKRAQQDPRFVEDPVPEHERLTDEEVEAIGWYRTNGGYRTINGHLRGAEQATAREQERIGAIRTFIQKSPAMEKDTVLFRQFRHNPNHVPGDVVELDGLTSASSDAPELRFGDMGYQIRVPKGAKGIGRGFNAGEREYVFDHKSKFRVVGKKSQTIDLGRGMVRDFETWEMEYIPPDEG